MVHRSRLSQVARQFEEHGREQIPFEISQTYIKFNIEAATKFLLSKYGLWESVEREEQITLAGTVDGGQLAWKLMQNSAVEQKMFNHQIIVSLYMCTLIEITRIFTIHTFHHFFGTECNRRSI